MKARKNRCRNSDPAYFRSPEHSATATQLRRFHQNLPRRRTL